MITIKKSTATEMMNNDNTLKLIEDIYERTYLIGTGAEILVVDDDSRLVNQISEELEQQNDRLSQSNNTN